MTTTPKVKWSLKDSPEGEGGNKPTVFQDLYCDGELVAKRIYRGEAQHLINFLNRFGLEGFKRCVNE